MTGFDRWAADLADRIRAKEQPAPVVHGEDEGEICNRDGCKGVIGRGIVGMHCAGGIHTEVYGLGCSRCEWVEG